MPKVGTKQFSYSTKGRKSAARVRVKAKVKSMRSKSKKGKL